MRLRRCSRLCYLTLTPRFGLITLLPQLLWLRQMAEKTEINYGRLTSPKMSKRKQNSRVTNEDAQLCTYFDETLNVNNVKGLVKSTYFSHAIPMR